MLKKPCLEPRSPFGPNWGAALPTFTDPLTNPLTSMKAVLNGTVLAESDDTEVVESNHYFPPESLNDEYLEPSDHRTTCPWKGKAHYYDLVIDGVRTENAAWYYPDPSDAASQIKDHVAFYTSQVEVTE